MEFVKGIRISQLEGKDVIRILQPDIRRFSNMKTLVLLDGIPFDDHETILNYDARLIHYIHRYTGKYTFGGELYDGIVSFITHRGTLPDIRLDKNSQMFSYEFPQKENRICCSIIQFRETSRFSLTGFSAYTLLESGDNFRYGYTQLLYFGYERNIYNYPTRNFG